MDRKSVIKKIKLAIQIAAAVIAISVLIYLNVNFFFLTIGQSKLLSNKNPQSISLKLIRAIASDVKHVNKNVLVIRKYMRQQHQYYKTVGKLSHLQYKKISIEYQLYNNFNPTLISDWNKLNEKINKIPASLLIAIAIYNLIINNDRDRYQSYYRMFAVHCHASNCGIAANTEQPYLLTAYRSYGNLMGAVFDEIYTMNSIPGYKRWRLVRAKLQQQNKLLSPYVLADALLLTPYYTQKKVNKIKAIIKQWRLERFD